ncbi:TetR/AcrR family transcriptional regulator [Actinomadura darangshiensis]|uniref:TetR/AcrR family transcriptional regulator n=1 Tax=Actinomadura darangshiensis TaxID=705336 RepID=A0A4R5B308_9ACTN|nr:TetR/AcrR family transcriptional regulator [Actinomadura darangshiensis]TDD77944.1 TetR/AcrR family transcriptional regulator [Actinomadura darangshiensis]
MTGDTHRPHTGRRRNEAARQAILDVAVELLGSAGDGPVTIDTIAAAAGVGKQTIYRWWPSKGAVLLEALAGRAGADIPVPDTGSLRADLEAFLRATFRAAGNPHTASALRHTMAEAQRDPHAREPMRDFLASRRRVLRGLLERARDRGEIASGADLDLIVDQAYGVLWIRILNGHARLGEAEATALAGSLAGQARG